MKFGCCVHVWTWIVWPRVFASSYIQPIASVPLVDSLRRCVAIIVLASETWCISKIRLSFFFVWTMCRWVTVAITKQWLFSNAQRRYIYILLLLSNCTMGEIHKVDTRAKAKRILSQFVWIFWFFLTNWKWDKERNKQLWCIKTEFEKKKSNRRFWAGNLLRR